jgi:hypothetical protein
MKQGQSTRALGGKVRIKYDPAWSPSKPFLTYRNGTAGVSFAGLDSAIAYLGGKRWSEWS